METKMTIPSPPGMTPQQDPYRLLKDAVNNHGGECDPECNSFGHTEKCAACNPAAWLESQQARIRELEAELDLLREQVAKFEALGEAWRAALGGTHV